MEAILSTIQTDTQVRRWFSFLISQPAVKSLLSNNTNTNKQYAGLKSILILQSLLSLSATIILLIIFFTKNYFLFLSFPLLIIPYYKLHFMEINCITQIAEQIVSTDFDQHDLKNKTLYQIGNLYNKKYGVPSLVNSIYNAERILFISLSLLTLFIIIFHNDIITSIIIALILFCAISQTLKSNLLYKHLKK